VRRKGIDRHGGSSVRDRFAMPPGPSLVIVVSAATSPPNARRQSRSCAPGKQAERASAAKSRFLATVSHELRTPLNAIVGFSEIIADQREGPIGHIRYADYARSILDGSRHLASLISDILDISRFENASDHGHRAGSRPDRSGRGRDQDVPGSRARQGHRHHPGFCHRADRSPRRDDEAAADHDQSGEQRLEIHARRRRGAGGPRQGSARRPGIRGQRQRDRHLQARPQAHLRAIRAGRGQQCAPLRRHRAGPCHFAQACPPARWRRGDHQQAGQGHSGKAPAAAVAHLAPAGACRAAIAAA
jgi:hypothetical protein